MLKVLTWQIILPNMSIKVKWSVSENFRGSCKYLGYWTLTRRENGVVSMTYLCSVIMSNLAFVWGVQYDEQDMKTLSAVTRPLGWRCVWPRDNLALTLMCLFWICSLCWNLTLDRILNWKFYCVGGNLPRVSQMCWKVKLYHSAEFDLWLWTIIPYDEVVSWN